MSVQQTLNGGESDGRERPSTMLYCPRCGDWVLRSQVFDHRHDVPGTPGINVPDPRDEGGGDGDDGEDEEDEDDEPERAGAMYEITLSYSVDYRFTIPAWNEHQAKEHAELLVDYPNNCADAHQVHSRDRERFVIMDDHAKLPDGFDVYGSTPLWEAWGAGEEDES